MQLPGYIMTQIVGLAGGRLGHTPPPRPPSCLCLLLRVAAAVLQFPPLQLRRPLPFSWNSRQVSVVMVRPGGTDRPMRDISARFAPLPPSCEHRIVSR